MLAQGSIEFLLDFLKVIITVICLTAAINC
jgi:hypothetical protein